MAEQMTEKEIELYEAMNSIFIYINPTAERCKRGLKVEYLDSSCLDVLKIARKYTLEYESVHKTEELSDFLQEINDEYGFIEGFSINDLLSPNKWIVLLCEREHGIYEFKTVDSEERALDWVRDPDLNGNGFTSVERVWHNGKELCIDVTFS